MKPFLLSTLAVVTLATSNAIPAPSMDARHVAVRESQVEGEMSTVKGSCPILTFTIAGTLVWMDSTTVLNGLSCAQLVNGTAVRVSGYKRADGSILASAIAAIKS